MRHTSQGFPAAPGKRALQLPYFVPYQPQFPLSHSDVAVLYETSH